MADIVQEHIADEPPLRFRNGEELVEYMKKEDKSEVILYVASPRHPIDGEMLNIGGNYVEGYFPNHTPYVQASDFRIGICSYARAEDCERELKKIKEMVKGV